MHNRHDVDSHNTVKSGNKRCHPEKKPNTKTYASLVQYDRPKVKSGVTLEAEFFDDGAGSGEGKVIYPGNRYFLAGTWTTLPSGQIEKPKLIDKKALNALRLLADVPLTTSRFIDNDIVLECLHAGVLWPSVKGNARTITATSIIWSFTPKKLAE